MEWPLGMKGPVHVSRPNLRTLFLILTAVVIAIAATGMRAGWIPVPFGGFTTAWLADVSYLTVALAMLVSPPELIMPAAAVLANETGLTTAGIVLAGTVGGVFGSIPHYFLARWLGEKRLRAWIRKYGRVMLVNERNIDRAARWFERHDSKVLVFGRFVPMVRSAVSIPAGLVHMPFLRFLALSWLGIFSWNALLVVIGAIVEAIPFA